MANIEFKFSIGDLVRSIGTSLAWVVQERIYLESRAGEYKQYKLMAVAHEVDLLDILEGENNDEH